jgi:TolA-binding protein
MPDAVVKKCSLEFETGRQQHIFSGSTWTITLQNRLIAELQSLLDRKLSTPQAAAALLLMSEIMEKPDLGHKREAADVLIKLYELDPVGRGDVLYRAAELYADNGDDARAMETYIRFIKDFPDDPRTTKAQERLTHLQPKENP